MSTIVYVPRINNNDDEVRLVSLEVAVGDRVDRGRVIASLETDKAVVDVEAPVDGIVLKTEGELDTMLRVGASLVWIGDPGESIADDVPEADTPSEARREARPATAKAIALMQEHGIDPSALDVEGERITVSDVERAIAARAVEARGTPVLDHRTTQASELERGTGPLTPGRAIDLSSSERGMLATVRWQRDHAVPGYVEVAFEEGAWSAAGERFASEHRLLMNPMLALMAHRLAMLASEQPRINSTIQDRQRIEYERVDLGFTVQSDQALYLVVVRDAASLEPGAFVEKLGSLQRDAIRNRLAPLDIQGATIGFTSMSRWKVLRHVPILAPWTSLMVAHSAAQEGRAVLGASYDHRVLNGGDVAAVLRRLSKP